MDLIGIPEAASLLDKSIQTIRRMIKAKKIPCKRQKTPQGFVYLVPKQNLLKFAKESLTSQLSSQTTSQKIKLGSRPTSQKKVLTSQTTSQPPMQSAQTDDLTYPRQHRPVSTIDKEILEKELNRFNATIQKLIEQNERDKENFFQLIKSFQDRVFVLENQIKLLEAPKKKWWRFWFMKI